MLGPKPSSAGEAALRLSARRGRGDWMALVVEPGRDVLTAAEELSAEMELLGDAHVDRIRGAQDAAELASRSRARARTSSAAAAPAGFSAWQRSVRWRG